MKRKFTLTITSTSELRVAVRVAGRVYCPHCQCEVDWVPAVEAAGLLEQSLATQDTQIPWDRLHYVGRETAVERICRRSLLELQRILSGFRTG